MGDGTGIEWTDATWNPTTGCSRVSPGCERCYAERLAPRLAHTAPYEGVVDDKRWTGRVNTVEDRLLQPIKWRRPRRVFVDSMSDLFHPDVPDEFIARVFAVMALAPQHTFQVLTKRPQRMAQVLGGSGWSEEFWSAVVRVRELSGMAPYRWSEPGAGRPATWPSKNVWLGTSVENQRYADLRIPHLLATPAAVRFLSIEPLLGPVNLGLLTPDRCDIHYWDAAGPHGKSKLDWIIVGGESGPDARPMHPDWVRSLRDQATAAGVPFFFKQWGEWLGTAGYKESVQLAVETGSLHKEWRDDDGSITGQAVRVGKKAAGRELDGRTWDEMPAARAKEEAWT